VRRPSGGGVSQSQKDGEAMSKQPNGQEHKNKRPGEGSIDQLPSGRWRVRLTLANQKRVTVGVYNQKEEAESVCRGAIAELAEGHLAPVGGYTLRAWGMKWLDRRELSGARNMRTDRQRWASHIETAEFVDWPMANIKPRDVRSWLAALRIKKVGHVYPGKRPPKRLSAQTVDRCHSLLRVCLQGAVDDELIEKNPAAEVRSLKEFRTDEPWTYLTVEEQNALVTSPDIPAAERAIIEFAIGTGLRQGEQWALELGDLHVDDDDPFVLVRFGSPGKPTKSGKIRRVPLFGRSLDAATTWLKLLPTYAPFNPYGLVFPTQRGCRRQKGTKLRGWRQFLKVVGIKRNVRWHDLRHTCASSLIAGWWGRPWRMEEVRELLGHSSIAMTERYAHLADTVLKGAARETQQALYQVTSRSREGQEMSQPAPGDSQNELRARHDSNVRHSDSKSDALSS
jgi:integrase